MNTFVSTLRSSFVVGLLAATSAQAAVVEHADVGGFRTFQDTLTGNVWVDLDAQLGEPALGAPPLPVQSYPTYSAYRAALQGAGFTWASTAQVMALLDTLEFSANAATARAEAGAYADVMVTRWFDVTETLMGIAQNSSTPTGQRRHGLTFASMPLWSTLASSVDFDTAAPQAVGLWAFMPAPTVGPAPVSAPGSAALVALSLALLARQQRARTTSAPAPN